MARNTGSTGSPQYLRTYDSQVGANIGGIRPNIGGYEAEVNAGSRNAAQMKAFTDSVTKFMATYANIRQERDFRDTNTLTSQLIRDRKIDIFSSKRGKDADGLLEEEMEWALKTREQVLEQSGLARNRAGEVWDKQAEQYLDRISMYMVEQGIEADKQSRFAAVYEGQNQLALSNVGDFTAYAQYSALVNDMYGPLTQEAIVAKEQGIDVLIDSWVAQNAGATVGWFKTNKAGLREVLGREFSSVNKAMERAENVLESRVRRQELYAARADRLRAQEQKRIDSEWSNKQLTNLLNSEIDPETGEPTYDINKVIKDGTDKGISGDALMDIYKATDSYERGNTKRTDNALRNTYMAMAGDGEFKEEAQTEMRKLLAENKVSATTYSQCMTEQGKAEKRQNEGINEQYKTASNYIKNAIAPRGGMDSVNQAAENKRLKVQAQFDNYLNSLDKPKDKIVAMNINDPNSYINQLLGVNTEGITPSDRLRDSFSQTPFDPTWTPVLPSEEVVVPEIVPRNPGESLKEYKARVGLN